MRVDTSTGEAADCQSSHSGTGKERSWPTARDVPDRLEHIGGIAALEPRSSPPNALRCLADDLGGRARLLAVAGHRGQLVAEGTHLGCHHLLLRAGVLLYLRAHLLGKVTRLRGGFRRDVARLRSCLVGDVASLVARDLRRLTGFVPGGVSGRRVVTRSARRRPGGTSGRERWGRWWGGRRIRRI